MKNLNFKNFLYLLLGISFILFYCFYQYNKYKSFNIKAIADVLPTIISIDIGLAFLFTKYLWKWRIFKGWLVPFPNLNGTWKGTILSTWIDPITNDKPAPIPVIITIKQSFINISCVMRTAEMTSRSVSSDFILDKENQINHLCYTYDSNPIELVRERSIQHCGTMLFDIIEKPTKKLIGRYWTSRKTTGHVELDYWKDELTEAYPDELGAHPVSQVRNNN